MIFQNIQKLALAVGLTTVCLAQQVKPEEATALDRAISGEFSKQPVPVAEALIEIFREAGSAAGIELKNCGRAVQGVSLAGGTVREALNKIRAVRPDLSVAMGRDGVAGVRNKDAGRLLDTVLAPMDVADADNLTAVAGQLLGNRAVMQAAQKMRLKAAPVQLGFSRLQKPGKVAAMRAEPVHLEGVTLRDALNRFAAAKGNGVWVYEESGCGDESFSLRFAVQ